MRLSFCNFNHSLALCLPFSEVYILLTFINLLIKIFIDKSNVPFSSFIRLKYSQYYSGQTLFIVTPFDIKSVIIIIYQRKSVVNYKTHVFLSVL